MITIKKILCPVDFFPASDAAVQYAVGLAANYNATIRLLHVVTPLPPAAYEYAMDTSEILQSMEESASEEMKKVVAKLKAPGFSAETEVRVGDVLMRSSEPLKKQSRI